ncbi:MAG TPA: pyrroline-5-carboxylate reductase dimerization domain-containing protein [Solirubrobacteraceae bacterium]|nr:pyrroline-5-carboxylate reductase dimerization domain-containing protein [Solirubrobacteraceae bacterium]
MRVGLIGSGNMARALARGWGEPVLCSDGGSGRAAALAAELGGRAADNLEVAQEADVVVLCHKPAQLEPVAREISGHARAVVSVLGSTSHAQLAACYPRTPLLRLIPNTPVQVRRGVTCHVLAQDVALRPDPELQARVLERFALLGAVIDVPEALAEVAMAVSSLGPAYQALLVEAQVDAAIRHGLGATLASRLAVQTMEGTAALLSELGHDTLALRREVTSPGGSTARGLDALERGGVRAAFQAAMDRVLRVGGC